MICKSCGSQNAQTATNCEACGAPLRGSVAASAGTGETPPNYLVQSILVTLCCCWPLGIPAIVFATRVDGYMRKGDFAGAQTASASAKKWCWIALVSGAAAFVIMFLLYVILIALAVTVQDQNH